MFESPDLELPKSDIIECAKTMQVYAGTWVCERRGNERANIGVREIKKCGMIISGAKLYRTLMTACHQT